MKGNIITCYIILRSVNGDKVEQQMVVGKGKGEDAMSKALQIAAEKSKITGVEWNVSLCDAA